MENSNNLPEENPAPTLAEVEVVRKFSTEKLIKFLREQEDLELDENDFKILRDEKITGRTFLKLTKEELERHGLKLGPATALVNFAKEVKEKNWKRFILRQVLLKNMG